MFSRCAKTQLNQDSLTLVTNIRDTKSLQLQIILAITHERNQCLVCSNSIEQKKHIPLLMFLLFNASPNGKALTITLQMNTLARSINREHQLALIT